MAVLSSIKNFLDERAIAYEVIHHRRDYTAQETAADTHTPGRMFAKTVMVWADGKFYMVVLPAVRRIDLDHLKQELGAKEVRLASEAEIAEICSDCEVGAMPPLGNLYNLPVIVSSELAEASHITFNAGTHEDAIRMAFADFRKLVQPQIIDLQGTPA